MKKSFIYAAKAALYAIILTGTFAACSNSTSSDDHEHEEEPVGFRIKQNNQTIVEQTATQPITGTISVTARSSSTFTVLFVSEDGDEFTPDVDEHSITVTTEDTIFSITNINSSTAPFSFTITGNDEGTGSFDLKMLHEGAAEFTRLDIPVEVTAAN
ncbi:MAG: hypothetical protein JXR20_10185 [Balneola sp.]